MTKAANPVVDFLLNRRSTVSRLLAEPGPDAAALDLILRASARVPDHGKLVPWRFVVIQGKACRNLGDKMANLYAAAHPDDPADHIENERKSAWRSPVIVTVVSAPQDHHKIPRWEQELSAGAVCQNMLNAAIAMGFGAQWLSGWAAFDPGAARLLRLEPGEQVAGFVHMGTYKKPLEDRPRPDMDKIVSEWTGAH